VWQRLIDIAWLRQRGIAYSGRITWSRQHTVNDAALLDIEDNIPVRKRPWCNVICSGSG